MSSLKKGDSVTAIEDINGTMFEINVASGTEGMVLDVSGSTADVFFEKRFAQPEGKIKNIPTTKLKKM